MSAHLNRFLAGTILAILLVSCTAPPPSVEPAVPTSPVEATQTATAAPPLPVMPPGSTRQTITAAGVVRHYLLHVPAGYDGSTPLPLIFVLHGYGGAPVGMEKSTGMSEKADQEGFFVAYLLGTGDVPGWNSGLTPGTGVTADDVEFVRALIRELSGRLRVDPARVYAAGFSNGAFMTNRLGAELPDLLAGVAIVEGTVGVRQSDGTVVMITQPKGPIPVIVIHGKQDANVLYDGGVGAGVGKLDAVPVADMIDFWTGADGCSGSPLEASSTANILIQDYRDCAAGTEVMLYTIVDGVHQWPTLQSKAKFSATDAIWDFFSRHPEK